MLLFLVTSCLGVAVQSCMEWTQLKKKSSEVISMKHNDQISAMNQEFKRASLFNISKHHFIPAIQYDNLPCRVQWISTTGVYLEMLIHCFAGKTLELFLLQQRFPKNSDLKSNNNLIIIISNSSSMKSPSAIMIFSFYSK